MMGGEVTQQLGLVTHHSYLITFLIWLRIRVGIKRLPGVGRLRRQRTGQVSAQPEERRDQADDDHDDNEQVEKFRGYELHSLFLGRDKARMDKGTPRPYTSLVFDERPETKTPRLTRPDEAL